MPRRAGLSCARALDDAQAGDVLTVWRLGRLVRSIGDLFGWSADRQREDVLERDRLEPIRSHRVDGHLGISGMLRVAGFGPSAKPCMAMLPKKTIWPTGPHWGSTLVNGAAMEDALFARERPPALARRA
ncbi:hypothetical protein BA895_07070 [Humibacillus sp. DSM 29435]|nr:hypothetical protein BA895_07070 [Humibacillus sp. DSM 29435]